MPKVLTSDPIALQWALPEALDVPPDTLRLRLDFYSSCIMLHVIEGGAITTRMVSPLDVAAVMARGHAVPFRSTTRGHAVPFRSTTRGHAVPSEGLRRHGRGWAANGVVGPGLGRESEGRVMTIRRKTMPKAQQTPKALEPTYRKVFFQAIDRALVNYRRAGYRALKDHRAILEDAGVTLEALEALLGQALAELDMAIAEAKVALNEAKGEVPSA